jgi:hypothetical protein
VFSVVFRASVSAFLGTGLVLGLWLGLVLVLVLELGLSISVRVSVSVRVEFASPCIHTAPLMVLRRYGTTFIGG